MANRITGLNSGLDTETLITALTSRYQTKVDKYKGDQKKLSWKQDKWKSLNKDIMAFYNGSGMSALRYSSSYNQKVTTVSDASVATVSTASNAINTTQTLEVHSLATAGYLTGGSLGDKSGSDTVGFDGSFKVKVGSTEKEISFSSTDTLSSIASKINNVSGVTASFDSNQHRFYIGADKMGKAADFEIIGSDGEAGKDGAGSDVLSKLGLNYNEGVGNKIAGKNAEIVLNGASYESTNNTFDINGLNITVNKTTGNETDGYSQVNLATTTDTSGIYDMIKDFFTQYNTLINKMDALYNADSADKYDMLTDEQKDSMKDSEIEDWENKIKSALLRKDDSLYDISQLMKQSMAKTFKINVGGEEKNVSLSYFGINTLGYFESEDNQKYAYHIDGDSDDDYTSSKDDVLKNMISTDPDAVVSFFTQISRDLYSSMYTQMRSTKFRSAYTVYEDKLMASNYSSYNSKINEAQDALNAKQDYYYSKFSAMETALAKINSSSTSFASLLGGTSR